MANFGKIFMNLFSKQVPKSAGQAAEQLAGRQVVRSQYYYNTLAKELEVPKSFYNPRTGRTTHTYAPGDSNIVSVTKGDKKLLSMDVGCYPQPGILHKYVAPEFSNKTLLYNNFYWRQNLVGRYGWTPNCYLH